MVFSSTIFLFLYLPVVITGYYLTPTIRFRNIFLLTASLFFYAWGEGFYLLLMLLSIIANYCTGMLINRLERYRLRWLTLVAGISLNLTLLASFKYANFATDVLNAPLVLLGFEPIVIGPVHLPIGISFFTFQAISYIIDVYRGEASAQKNPLDCGLYIALFPQLIAGPIVRYHDIASQITSRDHNTIRFSSGIMLFICGLSKKMLIANPMGGIADQLFALPPGELSTLLAWSGTFAYSLQIYFDFSGYSDMAIGLGRIFGFELLINFNYPYIASSFREFWQRWHISLSRWFKDYLYIPLGGNRHGPLRTGLHLFLVFFLCGLWHGAGWNFIIWGLLHGFFLVLERGFPGNILGRLWKPLRHIYLLTGVMVTWVFFRAETTAYALDYLQTMFTFANSPLHPLGLYWNRYTAIVAVIAICASTPLFNHLHQWMAKFSEGIPISSPLLCAGQICFSMLLYLLCAMELAAGTHNPFIYFRF